MGNSLRHGQKTSKSGQDAAKLKEKRMAKTKAVGDADNRKKMTGRTRQGNHDSNTKQPKKNDRHQHGIEQAGQAGSKKKK
jgi:hypothetical protein